MGHYGSRGVTAAAMVRHVLTTCVVFCACRRQECFHVAISAKIISIPTVAHLPKYTCKQVYLGSSLLHHPPTLSLYYRMDRGIRNVLEKVDTIRHKIIHQSDNIIGPLVALAEFSKSS